MCLIVVTRLKARSARHLPAFFAATLATVRQARRSPGFQAGQLATEPGRAFWTITAWEDQAAIRRYRDSGVHSQTMPKLKAWCRGIGGPLGAGGGTASRHGGGARPDGS